MYDPAHFNDRLLLGLKGTMSEAELHVLKARLRGGILNKARRGELEMRLPVGLRLRRAEAGASGSRRARAGKHPAVLQDVPTHGLGHRNGQGLPRAGAAVPAASRRPVRTKGRCCGRRSTTHARCGCCTIRAMRAPSRSGARASASFLMGASCSRSCRASEWIALVHDMHEGYISWQEYEQNLVRLRENAHQYGEQREQGAPREGPALLQGLVTVRHLRRANDDPLSAKGTCCARTMCASERASGRREPSMPDDQRLRAWTRPSASCSCSGSRQWRCKPRWPCKRSWRRAAPNAMRCAAGRSSGRATTAIWPGVATCRSIPTIDLLPTRSRPSGTRRCGRWSRRSNATTSSAKPMPQGSTRRSARASWRLAQDFPRLWCDPRTPQRERKRMARLLIADVTLVKGEELIAQVRFNGGTTHTLRLALPRNAWQMRLTPPALVAQIDRLLDDYTDGEIARRLDARGLRSGDGRALSLSIVRTSVSHTSCAVAASGCVTRHADTGRDRRALGVQPHHHQELAPRGAAAGAPLRRSRAAPVRISRCRCADQASPPGENAGAGRGDTSKITHTRLMRCTMQTIPSRCPARWPPAAARSNDGRRTPAVRG